MIYDPTWIVAGAILFVMILGLCIGGLVGFYAEEEDKPND